MHCGYVITGIAELELAMGVRLYTGTIELDNGGPVTGIVDLQIDVRLPEQ